jgi:hypothetical protein
MNTHAIQNAVSLIKKEIQNSKGQSTQDLKTCQRDRANFCQNSLTGSVYEFEKGSLDERSLFTVLSITNGEKLYFDSYDEYTVWAKKNKKLNRLHGTQVIKGIKAI